MANKKIICARQEEFDTTTQSLGKIIYEKLKKADRNLIAFINAHNTNEYLTYGNILEFSENLSINLRNFGIKTDDVIGIVSDNCIYYSLPILAGLYLGATVHLINSDSTQHELRHLFKISKPKIVFCSESSLENIELIRKEFNIEKLIILEKAKVNSTDILELNDLFAKTNNETGFELANNFNPTENVAIVLNSSGTTGLPKCVMLTHETLQKALNSRFLEISSYEQPIPGICAIPICHAYGFYIFCGSFLTLSKLIIINKFKTELFFELIQNFQIKRIFLVPTLIDLMINSSKTDKFNLSSIETIYSASSPLSTKLAENVVKKFNLKNLFEVYGSSECSYIAVSKVSKFHRNFSEGELFPWKLLKVTDLNTNEALGVSEFGEICLKGGILKGYMNDDEKTREAIDNDGFFRTGDGGYYDEKGRLYVTDRIKDMIKYKSFQISPMEVEEVLLRHPEIEDAAIVGKPDNHVGELPVAFIVRKSDCKVDENAIIDYVAKFFSQHKHLHGGVKFIDKIPRNTVGKILRKQLKELV